MSEEQPGADRSAGTPTGEPDERAVRLSARRSRQSVGAIAWERPRVSPSIHIGRVVPPVVMRAGEGRRGAWRRLKRVLIGAPLSTAEAVHERLSKVKALAVLSSDALSSVAYATEETLRVLVTVGVGAIVFSPPIAIAITVLLAIVTFSYRQTICAYPHGGGSYLVASDNLGRYPGLVAAAALLIDYVLTVAVSISSGTAALTSAVPALAPHQVGLALGFLGAITLVNLRGVRESGAIFAAPTYVFIVAVLTMIVVGVVKAAGHGAPVAVPLMAQAPAVGTVLILKAFSSGCSAMTGVEAISNGVPAFEKPEARNAANTMLWMSGLLATMFLGITYLAWHFRLVPSDRETVLSQLAHTTLGSGAAYLLVQGATLLVLVLAANTAYADFPRLSAILARDRFIPKQFAFRGDRLAFTVGILFLAAMSAALLVIFKGDTSALIPLYAVGVFVSFTLSQAGMVRHWFRRRGRHWHAKAAINGVGAVATAVVAGVAAVSKLMSGEVLFHLGGTGVHAGSWMVLVLVPLMLAWFVIVRRHYDRSEVDDVPDTPLSPEEIRHHVVVPVANLRGPALQTLAYACSISPHGFAVHVTDCDEAIEAFRSAWLRAIEPHPFLANVELVLVRAPYRTLVAPLTEFIDDVVRRHPRATVTVIVPELVSEHWWEHFLHNHVALRIKAALLFRPGIVVANVPHHLRSRRRRRPRPPAQASPPDPA
jgi:amino acid transporter